MSTGVRWVNPEGIHLTLKFLGDIDAALVEPLLNAVHQAGKDSEKHPFRSIIPSWAYSPTPVNPGCCGPASAAIYPPLAVATEGRRIHSRLGFRQRRSPVSPSPNLGSGKKQRFQCCPPGNWAVGARIPAQHGQIWHADKMHLIRSTRNPTAQFMTPWDRLRWLRRLRHSWRKPRQKWKRKPLFSIRQSLLIFG